MNRLPQLRKIAGIPGGPNGVPDFSPRKGGEGSGGDGKDADGGRETVVTFAVPPSEIDQDAADALDAFYADTAKIKAAVQAMSAHCADLQVRHSENIVTVDEVRSKQLRGDIDALSQEITDKARGAKEGLDAMNKSTALLRETPESEQANSAIIRIQENQYAFLVASLTGVMAVYQKHQSENEVLYKAQTQRQIKIKYTNSDGTAIDDATAQQLAEQVLENNTTSYVFQQSKDVLASIIETRNDIYRIEQSMRDLNQLFNDLALLVNEQGEIMDVIMSNIQRASRYVEKGRKELAKARKYQKKSRKKMICIVVCVVVIVVVLIVVGVVAGTIKL